MRSSPDKLLRIWQHTEKTSFYQRAITRPKIIQAKKPVQYAQGLELQINPVKVH
jgi:hypothetical protein